MSGGIVALHFGKNAHPLLHLSGSRRGRLCGQSVATKGRRGRLCGQSVATKGMRGLTLRSKGIYLMNTFPRKRHATPSPPPLPPFLSPKRVRSTTAPTPCARPAAERRIWDRSLNHCPTNGQRPYAFQRKCITGSRFRLLGPARRLPFFSSGTGGNLGAGHGRAPAAGLAYGPLHAPADSVPDRHAQTEVSHLRPVLRPPADRVARQPMLCERVQAALQAAQAGRQGCATTLAFKLNAFNPAPSIFHPGSARASLVLADRIPYVRVRARRARPARAAGGRRGEGFSKGRVQPHARFRRNECSRRLAAPHWPGRWPLCARRARRRRGARPPCGLG